MLLQDFDLGFQINRFGNKQHENAPADVFPLPPIADHYSPMREKFLAISFVPGRPAVAEKIRACRSMDQHGPAKPSWDRGELILLVVIGKIVDDCSNSGSQREFTNIKW
jgi:hypothetical protein